MCASPTELDECLASVGVFLPKHLLAAVFRAFDRDDSGAVNYDEFLLALRDNFNDRRKAMASQCFDLFDVDGSGELTLEDVERRFTPSRAAVSRYLDARRSAAAAGAADPDAEASALDIDPLQPVTVAGTQSHDDAVVRGAAMAAADPASQTERERLVSSMTYSTTYQQQLQHVKPAGGSGAAGAASSARMPTTELAGGGADAVYRRSALTEVVDEEKRAARALTQQFLNSFEGATGNKDGVVTRDEWMSYYADISASVDSDELFIGILESAFMIPENPAAAAKDVANALSVLRTKIAERTPGHEDAFHAAHRHFKKYDKDDSGFLSPSEFRRALYDIGVPAERRLIGAILKQLDMDGNGTVEFIEFCRKLYEDVDPFADAMVTTQRASAVHSSGGY